MNKELSLPSESECMRIMEEYGMLPNIVEHSIQVKNVACAIMDHLKDDVKINRSMVISGSLLHDIAKTRTIKTRELRHDLIGGEMLRKMNLDSLAEICESHVVFQNFDAQGPLEEREIVFYADKRVMHDTVVTLDNRVEDLVHRYGVNDKVKSLIRENKHFVLQIEKKIRDRMTVDLDDVLAQL